MKIVVFLTRGLQHYRQGFHIRVKEQLARADVHYRLLYSQTTKSEKIKGDLWTPEWAEEVPIRYFGANEHAFLWQNLSGRLQDVDMIVIGQHNKHLHNYPILLKRSMGTGPMIAFFGHGRGFQSSNPSSAGERLKSFLATKVDWWFPYTEGGKDAVCAAGFPPERVTVFNNSIDTSAIVRSMEEVDQSEVEKTRASLVGGSLNVGVYVGGIYGHKRAPFLIESLEHIRSMVPDFNFIVIGGGVDAYLFEEASQKYEWIHYMGPKFGREKTLLVRLAKVMLMPGLVGLAVLDSFAYGTPMVTTAINYHSPEFDYLKNGFNGVVVSDPENSKAYADAVTALLRDDEMLAELKRGCAESAGRYSIEAMAKRFADGVLQALTTGR